MFAGDDDLLNLIQIEANTLVDTVLDESVSIVNNSTTNQSSFNLPTSSHDIDYYDDDSDEDEQQQEQLSREKSYEENSFEQQQPSFKLPLININDNINSILNKTNNKNNEHAPISDEISENFAIKSDYDIIVKSPTIESMSGKSFEDVDDYMNYTVNSAINDVSLDNVSALHSIDNITATYVPNSDEALIENGAKNVENKEEELGNITDDENIEHIVQVEAQKLVDEVLQESLQIIDQNDRSSKAFSSVTFAQSIDNENFLIKQEEDLNEELSNDDLAIVRNIDEHKLHRVERKFEHLSSEVRDDDPVTVEDLVSKDDISLLQTDFSKISWDESLSATTGELASNTPDNDSQDVLNIPGDTYEHNKKIQN